MVKALYLRVWVTTAALASGTDEEVHLGRFIHVEVEPAVLPRIDVGYKLLVVGVAFYEIVVEGMAGRTEDRST